jgi:thiamine biosynthesis lipoprotein
MHDVRQSRIGLVALGLTLVVLGCNSPADVHHFSFETMGTVASGTVEVWDKTVKRLPSDVVAASFDSVDVRLSSWRDDSEVGQINLAPADSVMPVGLWLSDCLFAAQALHDGSGGAFDITAGPLMHLWGFYQRQGHLPSQVEIDTALSLLGGIEYDSANRTIVKHNADVKIDLGGIAKGYAVDLAIKNLIDFGISAALIDLGGNLYGLGIPDGRDAWVVGVRDPRDRDRMLGTFSIVNRAVASSGSYERFVEIDGRRYGHIMNPATGQPAEGLLGTTVIHHSATFCDGLSTTLFVAGPAEAIRLLQKTYHSVDAILVLPPSPGTTQARVVATPGLRGNIQLADDRLGDTVLTYLKR